MFRTIICKYKFFPAEKRRIKKCSKLCWQNKGRKSRNYKKSRIGGNVILLNKFGSKYNLIQNIFWAFALFVSYGICLWQVYISVEQFLSYPIGVTVTVEAIETFNFPAVTICPTMSKVTQYFNFTNPLLQRCEGQNSSIRIPTCLSSFKGRKLPTLELWNEEQIHLFKESIGDRRRKNYDNTSKVSHVHTHIGKCVLIYLEEKFVYTGKGRKRWTIIVQGINSFSGKTFDMVFALHSSKVVNKYNTFGDPLEKKKYRYAELYMKELHRINTKQKPCLKEEESVNCINKCYDKMFENTKVVCKLPYVETIDLEICDTLEKISHFQRYEVEKQQEWKCDCPRPCDTVLYTIDNKITEDVNNNKFKNASIISMVMWRPFCDVVTEFLSFPFSGLLTSLAGNLGFFLGISLLNMLEIVRGSLIKCHKK